MPCLQPLFFYAECVRDTEEEKAAVILGSSTEIFVLKNILSNAISDKNYATVLCLLACAVC